MIMIRFNRWVQLFISIASLAIMVSACYLYNGWWGIEILSFLIPPIIVLNLFLIFWFFRKKSFLALFPASVLILSIKPIDESFALNFKKDDGTADFRVMSYNVGLFNPERFVTQESDLGRNLEKYEWLRNQKEPDILCLQEFYHSDVKFGEEALDSIAKAGNYNYYYLNPFYDKDHEGFFGVITFSKFKAIQSGELKYGTNYMNKGTWNDFIIKNDTVRILNFHLQSMSIRLNYESDKSLFKNIASNASDVYLKLKDGFAKRKEELNNIEKFIESSPYKIIICADLNALPYSYTYQKLKGRFNNAFEDAGTGFGFTYHHFPWFIRIDNQFYDKNLKIHYFKTHSKMKISDHYPIEAGYSFK
jgi:endonuclease/exonuclease/phosphatase family metal-dependent hydrolase